MPDPHKLKDNKSLQFLGPLIHEPNLWHLNRHSVTKAFAIGLFWTFIPMPFQMVAAAFCALRLNANLPLSVVTVWISNPVTMPPIFYSQYLLGAWLLDIPPSPFEYQLSFTWLKSKIYEIGIPLYLGGILFSVFFSTLGYYLINWLWLKNTRHKWNKRCEERTTRDKEAER